MENRRFFATYWGKPAAIWLCVVLVLACVLFLAGCDALDAVLDDASQPVPQSAGTSGGGGKTVSSGPPRDTTPAVLMPEAPGTDLVGDKDGKAVIDVSNRNDGYIVVQYNGDNPKTKLQVYYGGGTEPYKYNLTAGQAEVFPLTQGSGRYKVEVWENIEGTRYAQLSSDVIEVELEDDLKPFLYPNQYIDFTPQSEAVAAGAEIAQGAVTELNVVENIYNYVSENITYDYDKAATVKSGYLPDIDETLETGKGICFDYAALTAAMLRTQGIPTKLVIGYVNSPEGEVYHAWIRVYTDETGWVDVIEFTADTWELMDPTFAASGASQYTGDGEEENYKEMYFY